MNNAENSSDRLTITIVRSATSPFTRFNLNRTLHDSDEFLHFSCNDGALRADTAAMYAPFAYSLAERMFETVADIERDVVGLGIGISQCMLSILRSADLNNEDAFEEEVVQAIGAHFKTPRAAIHVTTTTEGAPKEHTDDAP